jgi:hypothetical protein
MSVDPSGVSVPVVIPIRDRASGWARSRVVATERRPPASRTTATERDQAAAGP